MIEPQPISLLGTVRTHVGRIFNKLSLRDRTQAVILAYETGLIRPGRARSISAR